MKNLSRILSSIIYASAFVFVGLYTNYSLRITHARQIKADVAIAAYAEQQARHEAMSSIYNSAKIQLTLDQTKARLDVVCKKAKSKVCL